MFYAIWGRLEFPEGGIARWRSTAIQYGELRGGPREGPFCPGDSKSETVGEAIEELNQATKSSLSATVDGNCVRFSGDLDEDLLRELGRDLAGAIRRAADASGRGEVVLVEEMAGDGYRFTVEEGRSRIEELGPTQIERLLAAEAGKGRLEGPQVGPSIERREPGPKAKRKGKKQRRPGPLDTLSPEEHEVHDAIVAAVDRLAPDSLMRAVTEGGGELLVQRSTGEFAPIADVFSDVDELRLALRNGDERLDLSHEMARDDWFFRAGLALLSSVDPDSALPVALKALEVAAPCSTLKVSAIAALGTAQAPQATQALLGLLRADIDASHVARALTMSPAENVGDEALALLSDDALQEEPDEPMLAKYAMDILAVRRHESAVPRLLAIWRTAKNPDMRILAGKALLAIDSPSALEGLLDDKKRLRSAAKESSVYIQALFQSDSVAAFDALASLFTEKALSSKKGQTLGRRVFAVLAEDAIPRTGKTSRGWLRGDPRWVERGLPMLALDPHAEDVLLALPYSGDARIVSALEQLFGEVDPFTLYEAFERLDSQEAIPVLEKHSKRLRKADQKAAVNELLAKLRTAGSK